VGRQRDIHAGSHIIKSRKYADTVYALTEEVDSTSDKN